MTSSKVSHFCLFCYKTFDSCKPITDSHLDIKQFVKTLRRFVKFEDEEQDILQNNKCLVDKFLFSCSRCKRVITDFCDVYHKMKLLELQLDWLLNKLIDKIDYANKVPTRWISLTGILEEFFQKDKEKQANCRNLIRTFRQNVGKAGRQRKLQSKPRVVLSRNLESTYPNPKHLVSVNQHDRFTELETKPVHQICKDKVCIKCGQQLKYFKGLYVHLEKDKIHGKYKLQFGQCDKTFDTNNRLTAHVQMPCGGNSVSQLCGYNICYKHSLKRHLSEKQMNKTNVKKEFKKKGNVKLANLKMNFKTNRKLKKFARSRKRKFNISSKITCYKNDNFINLNFNGHLIDSMVIPGENDGLVYLPNADMDPLHVEQVHDADEILDIKIHNADDFIDQIDESESTAVFEDPQIEIKMEHPALDEPHKQYSVQNCTPVVPSILEEEEEKKRTDEFSAIRKRLKTSAEIRRQLMRISLKKISSSHKTEKTIPVYGNNIESSSTSKTHLPYPKRKNKHLKINKVQNIGNNPGPRDMSVKCEVCNRRLTSLSKKESHVKICHDFKCNEGGEKPIIKCKYVGCTAYFLKNVQLNLHYTMEHNMSREMQLQKIGNETNRFVCPKCGKKFADLRGFKKHQENHNNSSQLKCEPGK